MNLNENRINLTHERAGMEEKERANDVITFIKAKY